MIYTERGPLRDRIRDTLLDDLLEGHLSPGQRVGVSRLAERFDVSLTPAREALTQLEYEGILRLEPNRGFFVAPLTTREAEQIYPLLATLEGLAVELQPPLPASVPAGLRELNALLLQAEDDRPERLHELDLRWHETLTSGCPNRLVLDHLASVRQLAERYERAYMRHAGPIPTSVEDHRRIVEALETDPGRITTLLRHHWSLSSRFIREWLDEPGNGDPS